MKTSTFQETLVSYVQYAFDNKKDLLSRWKIRSKYELSGFYIGRSLCLIYLVETNNSCTHIKYIPTSYYLEWVDERKNTLDIYKFYYSEIQNNWDKQSKPTYFKGKKYTECINQRTHKHHGCNFDDVIYLGEGTLEDITTGEPL